MNHALRILLLDDDRLLLKIHAMMLANLGYADVTSCDNGVAALPWVDADTDRHKLIFLDLNMPGMDGLQFVRELAKHGYRGDLVLLSGEDERTLHAAEKSIQALNLPVLGHLCKPVSREQLTDMLGKATQPVQPMPRSTASLYQPSET